MQAIDGAWAVFNERIRSAVNAGGKVVRNGLPVRQDLEDIAERARRIDAYRIQRILAERGVTSLFHFTPFENLKSLASFGLMSRADLVENQVGFTATDQLRIDGVNNASCLSLAFPNYKMFYQKRCSMTDIKHWAVLEICPSVLWENPCLFLPRNAAALEPELKTTPGHFLGAPALARVFNEPDSILRGEMGLRSDLPTNPQTEILAFGRVSNDKVKGILTIDAASARIARTLVLGSEFENRLRINASVFKPRCDFSFWVH